MLYAFDGTWQSKDSKAEYGAVSNVVRFLDLYEATTGDPVGGVLDAQEEYQSGIGTMSGRLGRLLGGALGIGGKRRVEDAYGALCKNWANGDTEIHIVGFSRGAALALDFANVVHSRGIVSPDSIGSILEGRSRTPAPEDVVEPNPHIGFLGLWDNVVAVGVPRGFGRLPLIGGLVGALGRGLSWLLGYRFGLPPGIGRTVHALAADECRLAFWPLRLKGAHEVWFEGGHADIGGGNGNMARNKIALAWMGEHAEAAGLPINRDLLDDVRAGIDLDADIRVREAGAPKQRRIRKGDQRHASVRISDPAIDARFRGTVPEVELNAPLEPAV